MENMQPQPVIDLAQAAINVIAFVITLAVSAGIVGKVMIWVRGKFEEFKATQPENVRKLIEWAVMTAAEFVEKLELSGQLEDYARSKKNLALDYAKQLLLAVGLDVDLSVLDAALESILFRNPQKFPSGSNQQPTE